MISNFSSNLGLIKLTLWPETILSSMTKISLLIINQEKEWLVFKKNIAC